MRLKIDTNEVRFLGTAPGSRPGCAATWLLGRPGKGKGQSHAVVNIDLQEAR